MLHWNLVMLNLQQAGAWPLGQQAAHLPLRARHHHRRVAAVIVMLALGNAAQVSVNREIAMLGSNRLVVIPNFQNTGRRWAKRRAPSAA